MSIALLCSQLRLDSTRVDVIGASRSVASRRFKCLRATRTRLDLNRHTYVSSALLSFPSRAVPATGHWPLEVLVVCRVLRGAAVKSPPCSPQFSLDSTRLATGAFNVLTALCAAHCSRLCVWGLLH